jgi:hypothetical protein
MDNDSVDLGTCCECGGEPTPDNPVRTLMLLDFKMPEDVGNGWGCFQCGLPMEGATAVICDACAESIGAAGKIEPRYIMVGTETKCGRLAIDQIQPKIPHRHNMALHPEEDGFTSS